MSELETELAQHSSPPKRLQNPPQTPEKAEVPWTSDLTPRKGGEEKTWDDRGEKKREEEKGRERSPSIMDLSNRPSRILSFCPFG